MALKTSKINVHYPTERNVPSAEKTPAKVACKTGPMQGPNLKNLDIEKDDLRVGLKIDEANICITIRPGQQLGQVFISSQYEGRKGAYNACLEGQNELALRLSEWMEELLGDSEEDWDVVIDAEPCPKATEPYRIVEASLRMEHALDVRQDPKIEPGPQAVVTPTVDVNNARS